MNYLGGWCKSERRLEGCTAIVTGCNTGIGKETALALYARGETLLLKLYSKHIKKSKHFVNCTQVDQNDSKHFYVR